MSHFLILAIIFALTFGVAASVLALILGYVWPTERDE